MMKKVMDCQRQLLVTAASSQKPSDVSSARIEGSRLQGAAARFVVEVFLHAIAPPPTPLHRNVCVSTAFTVS